MNLALKGLGVAVELSKALDTVEQSTLIKKPSYFGIKEPYLKWFKSYLSSRK